MGLRLKQLSAQQNVMYAEATNMNDYQTVKEFIDEFRGRVGDTDCDIPTNSIIAYLNTALRRLAREKGLDKLFRFQDTIELASINNNGMPSAAWNLKLKGMGAIIDIISLRVLDKSSCAIFDVNPCYLPYKEFYECNAMPEQNDAGAPTHFTLQNIQGQTRILFDRPIDGPYAIDMFYSAFHPRIKTVNETVMIPYGYSDILTEAVIIFYNMEAADFASARALYEDYDKLVAEARELLAKQPTGTPFRLLRGSF